MVKLEYWKLKISPKCWIFLHKLCLKTFQTTISLSVNAFFPFSTDKKKVNNISDFMKF